MATVKSGVGDTYLNKPMGTIGSVVIGKLSSVRSKIERYESLRERKLLRRRIRRWQLGFLSTAL